MLRPASRFLVRLALTACALHGAAINPSWADHNPHEPTTVTISVRTIEASEPTKEAQEADHAPALKLDNGLTDIEERLVNLPFSSFQLLSSKKETITIKKKNAMQLPNGQTLWFRPMYMEHKKVGLWLSWKERDGSEILNTRVHFDSNDAVVTGTDCESDKGLILAIRAVPVEAAP
jgi:hypothetical protein